MYGLILIACFVGVEAATRGMGDSTGLGDRIKYHPHGFRAGNEDPRREAARIELEHRHRYPEQERHGDNPAHDVELMIIEQIGVDIDRRHHETAKREPGKQDIPSYAPDRIRDWIIRRAGSDIRRRHGEAPIFIQIWLPVSRFLASDIRFLTHSALHGLSPQILVWVILLILVFRVSVAVGGTTRNEASEIA